MTWILGIVAASVASGLAVVAFAPGLRAEVFLGMLGPLVAVTGTWGLVEYTSRVNPAGVAGALMAAFVVKMLFFGAYVAVVLVWAGVESTPFAVSFTAYFIVLYATEALHLRRLARRLT